MPPRALCCLTLAWKLEKNEKKTIDVAFTVIANCLRFASPAEATHCLEDLIGTSEEDDDVDDDDDDGHDDDVVNSNSWHPIAVWVLIDIPLLV